MKALASPCSIMNVTNWVVTFLLKITSGAQVVTFFPLPSSGNSAREWSYCVCLFYCLFYFITTIFYSVNSVIVTISEGGLVNWPTD